MTQLKSINIVPTLTEHMNLFLLLCHPIVVKLNLVISVTIYCICYSFGDRRQLYSLFSSVDGQKRLGKHKNEHKVKFI